MVFAFTGIFVVWLMVLRPEQWPSSPGEWLTAPAWLSATAQVLSQVLLVAILFAIGRGLGGLASIGTVEIGPIAPLSISFLAIPLCRILWDAHEAAAQGYFLDEEAEAAHSETSAGAAAMSIIPLLNLPDSAADDAVAAEVARVLDVPAADLRLNALTAALANPSRSHAALRRALVLWSTEPEIVAPGLVAESMANAFDIADRDLDLLRLYVPRAMALINAFPNRAADFPSPDRLRQVADNLPASDLPDHLQTDLREGLRTLARTVEDASGRSVPAQSAAVLSARPTRTMRPA